MEYLLQWFTATHRGCVRENNEDSVLSYPDAEFLAHQPAAEPPGGRLCILADGMGGMRGGQEASRMAVQRIGQLYYNQNDPDYAMALIAAILQTNNDIALVGQSDPALEKMGTTVVLAVADHDRAIVVNIGDSRAYRWRDGQLTILSVDDRWVAAQVRNKILTEAQAQNHAYRNVILQYLGSSEPITPHVCQFQLQPDDRLLLCSDGIFEAINDETIALTLADAPAQAVQRLIALALEQRASDNVTVAIGYYGPLLRPTHQPNGFRTWTQQLSRPLQITLITGSVLLILAGLFFFGLVRF